MSITSIRVEFTPTATASEVADDILIATAVCLARLGRADVAVDLVLRSQDAPLLHNEDVANRLAPAFGHAGRWREAGDLALRYRLEGGPELFEDMLRLTPILWPGDLPEADAIAVAASMAAAAELEQEDSGPAWYTLGDFILHRVHDYEGALAAYRRAAEARPDYVRQGYYLAELAAAEFENGSYKDAAASYERAHRLTPDPSLFAKRADCLAQPVNWRSRLLSYVATNETSTEPPPDNGP